MEDEISYLVGKKIEKFSPLPPYSDEVCNFLSDFSSAIMKDNRYRQFPDVATVAFFARTGNIQRLRKNFVDNKFRLGKGLAFHITPSNIPVQFIFSYFFGILAGNANIVRVPSKNFPQIDFLCEILNKILSQSEHKKISEMTAFVRYDRNSSFTEIFSSQCQLRLIWGGDSTVQNIRKIILPPKSIDIVFPDRYSIAILNECAVESLNDTELENLAQNFFNDTYLVDQNACSSPHLILWKSFSKFLGREKFWSAVHNITMKKYFLPQIKSTSKYTTFCQNALNFSQTKEILYNDNFLYRTKLDSIFEGIENLRGIFGLFYEYNLKSFADLKNIVSEKFQTLTYFGFEPKELAQLVQKNGWRGIDRIVPIGRALDMNVIWDGYDLINQMSRIIFFE